MTLYKQVNGKRIPLSEEETAQIKQAWEAERKLQYWWSDIFRQNG